MRIFFASIFLCAWSFSLQGIGPVTPVTSEVTVYRSGAKISSVATVKVPAGTSEVIFENLPPGFNNNSLQVKIAGNARLNSAVFQLKDPVPAPENPRARVIRDSLVLLGDVLALNKEENNVLADESQMLQKNSVRVGISAPGQPGTLSVAELRELANYYRQRQTEIKQLQQQLVVQQRDIQKEYARLQAELKRLYPNTGNTTGEIVLKIDATGAQILEITCIYLVDNAAWTPVYDLRSAGLNTPLQLTYKASIRNGTGFDWKGVQLHLSSAQPMANNDRPVLNPVFVDFRPVVYYQQPMKQANDALNVYQMEQVATAPAAPPPPPYPGDDNGMAPSGSIGDTEAGDLSTFDLATPQDIPSDGEEHIVTVDKKDMPASYEYHTVPKIEPTVFLLAKVADYGQYNLLPGNANIFFQETYVGQTWVDPQTTADTLLLSLGRDEQLTVKRVQPKEFKERRKIFGSKVRDTYLFEITVKNNKSLSVDVTVLDQVPVSKQKDIEVSLQDRGGAQYNAEFGKLEWQISVPAGQSKKVRFSYTVEYPKDKAVRYFKS